jgi:hypothetical protein
MVEQQYVASARSYVMNSDVLGDIAPAESADPDPASAARLAALCARTQRDVTFLMSAARSAGVRLKTLSLEEDLYFSTAQSRTDFMNDLVDAVQNVIADHDANLETTDKVRAFRLLLACYPQPD